MLLNDELELKIPQEALIYDEAERNALNTTGGAPQFVIGWKENHLIVSVAWKKVNGFAAMLVSTKDACKNAEKAIAEAQRPFGYQLKEFKSTTIGGEKTEGFRYTYTAQDIDMTADTFVIKRKSTFYYIYCYSRTANAETNDALWQNLLTQAEWR